MDRLLLPFLASLCLLACSNPGTPAATATPSPPAATSPPPPAIAIRPPAEAILADAEVGLARVSARDSVSLAQAASEAQNQPLALTQYRLWGWVDESTRSWSGGPGRLDESLLLVTRPEGATLAFQGWAGELPQRGACPAGLGLDDCGLGSTGLVGRVGRYVLRLSGAGVDLPKLAGVQAGRIRRP